MMTGVPMPSPLPVKDGIGPTRLRVPASGPWATIAAYVVARFDHLDADDLYRRFDAGEIVGSDGSPIGRGTALGAHRFIWYYRDLPVEEPMPFQEEILHVDDDLVVIDKPHFLPTTPGGRYLRESALVRLRTRLDNPDLTPIHRLDRATAGLVMFSARPATRGAYQSLFEKRRVVKVYEAVSARPPGWDPDAPALAGRALPTVYRNHIEARRGELRVVVDNLREPNAETVVEVCGTGVSASGRAVLHTVLRPHTGRMHQLRVHLAALGAGILGDRWYPDLLPEAPDDHSLPLQLLARELEFRDPLSGTPRRFVTRRTLGEAPVPGC
ncbi:pseudouridine synthase [Rhodococcus ruber Chol-4]|uniref:pseudouridine synthase n=1 Tax=Rhodococcus TaxID=1827 RepID=UPI00029A6C92|nr:MULTISPECIES: pseudouridine synthase [Rhodococcus]MDO2378856.1 pseudouridine synthase [Rhodococcus ruber]ATQ31316.1 pseudouridine synthase [Rhodococcus ruber]KXF88009.1 pseudouridine synthase [Rhodococcus ruber Chol-4]MCZ1070898.1 pseudouridine synthase [Rhodococcus sp. A5(2022)]MDO1477365.1 pseudouridine synthase [Rhodococcus ruber]